MKILAIFAALLVAACGRDAPPPATGTGATGPAAGVAGQVQPGTQRDFEVNIGDRVFFGFDRFDLNAEARAVLDRQAAWLREYPQYTIVIEGHADERGTREYNLGLGERRANSISTYLIAAGVQPNRIRVVSYGKERPAVIGSNEAAWAQNRRGVTVLN